MRSTGCGKMKSLCVAVVFLVALCGAAKAAHKQEHWSYVGKFKPSRWGKLAGNTICGAGKNQSPIDIAGAKYSALGKFTLSGWDQDPGQTWSIKNNGHSATVTVGPGISTSGGGLPGVYNALQFHFHWGSDDNKGSEHTVGGQRYPLEMHVVHAKQNASSPKSVSDGLAVLGCFFEISADDNESFKPVIDALAAVKHVDSTANVSSLALSSLLPDNIDDFYRYNGSLTTPGCNEAVVWTLFKDTCSISSNQLTAFRSLLDSHGHALENNFRPTQALNGRKILASFSGDDASNDEADDVGEASTSA